jgi:hypothetical protein
VVPAPIVAVTPIGGVSAPALAMPAILPGDGLGSLTAAMTAPLSEIVASLPADTAAPIVATVPVGPDEGIVAVVPSTTAAAPSPVLASSASPVNSPAIGAISAPATPAPASDARGEVTSATTAPQPSTEAPAPAPAVVLGPVAASATTADTLPGATTATDRAMASFAMAGGLDPIFFPGSDSDSPGARRGPAAEEVGPTLPIAGILAGSDAMPVPVALASATPDGDPSALATDFDFDAGLPADVVDLLDFGTLRRFGLADEADPDSDGTTDPDHALVGFAIASVIGLAWGNYVYTSRIADRDEDEDREP